MPQLRGNEPILGLNRKHSGRNEGIRVWNSRRSKSRRGKELLI
jgi:hypothetical protein